MILFGGSGHAKVIRDCIRAAGGEVSFIFDDDPTLSTLDDTPVQGSYNSESGMQEEILVAVGDNLIRKQLVAKIKHRFGKVVHPSAVLSSYITLAEGSVVMQLAVINAGTRIGKHCIVNTATVVEHDCVVEDFVHLSPNVTLCGNVKVGEGTHIGAGATVIPGVSVGKWCVIGAGTVVTENVADFSLIVGVPGKFVRSLAKTV